MSDEEDVIDQVTEIEEHVSTGDNSNSDSDDEDEFYGED